MPSSSSTISLLSAYSSCARAKARSCQAPPRSRVHRGDERRAEVTARHVRRFADANDRADVDAHAIAGPSLGDRGLARRLAQLQRAAAGPVRRRNQQQVIGRRPHRRADVEAPVGAMRMAPQRLAVGRIEAGDPIAAEEDDLRLTIDRDQHRRRRRYATSPPFHNSAPDSGWNAPSACPRPPIGMTMVLLTSNGLFAMPRSMSGAPVLLHEVVRPQHLAAVLVERHELAAQSDDEETRADDEGRGVRSDPLRVVNARRRRAVAALPDRLAARRIERGDDFLLSVASTALGRRAVLRVEPAGVDENRRMAFAKRARPQPAGAAGGPGIGKPGRRHHEIAGRSTPLGPRRRGGLGQHTGAAQQCQHDQDRCARFVMAHSTLRCLERTGGRVTATSMARARAYFVRRPGNSRSSTRRPPGGCGAPPLRPKPMRRRHRRWRASTGRQARAHPDPRSPRRCRA